MVSIFIGGFINAGYNYWTSSNVITTVDVKKLPNATDPTISCMEQIKTLGRTFLPLELRDDMKFFDIYNNQTGKLLSFIKQSQGSYFFLLEGVAKQGKSTYGKNLHNIFIDEDEKNIALYFELKPDNPQNLFRKLNKCDWNTFELALYLLQNNTKTKILMVIDDIQYAFSTPLIAAGLFANFKSMKTTHLTFLYISSQNSVIRKFR